MWLFRGGVLILKCGCCAKMKNSIFEKFNEITPRHVWLISFQINYFKEEINLLP